MVKYIETDINQGILSLRCAIMNILFEIECNRIKEKLLSDIPLSLIIKCALERDWNLCDYYVNPQGGYSYVMKNSSNTISIDGNLLMGEINLKILTT